MLLGMGGTLSLGALTLRDARADLLATPPQMEGPFYPPRLPLDRDNDLTRVDGHEGPAYGVVTDVSGHIVDVRGAPLPGVLIEIWQVNGYGRYHHPDDRQDLPYDPSFQGYGRTVTREDGAYGFRTVRPVPYPGRAPHIHFALSRDGGKKFYTQMYVAGAPENASDFVLGQVRDPRARDALIVPLVPSPVADSTLTGRFDIVLGHTPVTEEP